MTALDNKICPLSNELCSDCIKVAQNWDTERLFKDLAEAKTFYLRPDKKESNTYNSQGLDIQLLDTQEECYLRLLLNGLSYKEMTDRFKKAVSTIKTQICNSIYKYITEMTQTSVNNPYQVSHILEKHEYRKPPISSIRVINTNPNAPNSDVVEDKEMIALIDQYEYIDFQPGGLPKVIRKIQH